MASSVELATVSLTFRTAEHAPRILRTGAFYTSRHEVDSRPLFSAHDGAPAVGVRPFCRLKVNTAESAICAASAGKLRVVLHDYQSEPILVHAAQTLISLKMRCFMEFGASRLSGIKPQATRSNTQVAVRPPKSSQGRHWPPNCPSSKTPECVSARPNAGAVSSNAASSHHIVGQEGRRR